MASGSVFAKYLTKLKAPTFAHTRIYLQLVVTPDSISLTPPLSFSFSLSFSLWQFQNSRYLKNLEYKKRLWYLQKIIRIYLNNLWLYRGFIKNRLLQNHIYSSSLQSVYIYRSTYLSSDRSINTFNSVLWSVHCNLSIKRIGSVQIWLKLSIWVDI